MMVLAFIVLVVTVTLAVLTYVSVNVRTSRTYRDVAERRQAAANAADAAITVARRDPTVGRDGETYTVSYQGADADCTGMAGSGMTIAQGTADREIRCEMGVDGSEVLVIEFRVADQGGSNPGAAVQITRREVQR